MKKQNQRQQTPENYIRTRARSLPVDSCYVNSHWKESGMASIIVARKHNNGNFTIGIYLVDLFALGTKDTYFQFNIQLRELDEIIEKMGNGQMIKAGYALVHNIIYGANAFAEDNGFRVYKDFSVTQFILEEDTEDIELIEIEFGNSGKTFLIQ